MEEVSQNLVGLHVYYESLSYMDRREDKKMTWSALLSKSHLTSSAYCQFSAKIPQSADRVQGIRRRYRAIELPRTKYDEKLYCH